MTLPTPLLKKNYRRNLLEWLDMLFHQFLHVSEFCKLRTSNASEAHKTDKFNFTIDTSKVRSRLVPASKGSRTYDGEHCPPKKANILFRLDPLVSFQEIFDVRKLLNQQIGVVLEPKELKSNTHKSRLVCTLD